MNVLYLMNALAKAFVTSATSSISFYNVDTIQVL